MSSISVEHSVGEVAIGYTYIPETQEWYTSEQYGQLTLKDILDAEGVPEYIKKAVSILMEGE